MESKEIINPYGYLEKNEFTSELFKIEIRNLFTKVGFSQLKQRLQTLDLKPHKIKILPEITYVTFRCEEDRDVAITKVDGHAWKGKILAAKIAKAKADPFLLKRKGDFEDVEEVSNKILKLEEDTRTEEEKLKDHVVKFWRLPYEDQLIEKEKKVIGILKNMYGKMNKLNPNLKTCKNYFSKSSDSDIICSLEPIRGSPVFDNYRNKCEFTIGMTLDGQGPIAGFCHGKYRGGIDAVGNAKCLPIIPKEMSCVIDHVNTVLMHLVSERFTPKLEVYRVGSNTGHLRGITLRTGSINSEDDIIVNKPSLLMIIDIHPQELNEEDIQSICTYFQEYFQINEGKICGITSVMLSLRRNNGEALDLTTTRIVYGSGYVFEKLKNLNFRVSFNAFFQVNTLSAETLYGSIRQMLKDQILIKTSNKVTLLDVCCGTGTIGLSMADLVDRVVGIEMCAEAVNDAKINMSLNAIENVSFCVGKAEDSLSTILGNEMKNGDREFVAIVDPPRAGLHPSVIQALRRCDRIKKIIYVSCNPEAAQNNFIDFVRPLSKRTLGCPFIPESAICVDLFPHTNHVELVMLLTRLTT